MFTAVASVAFLIVIGCVRIYFLKQMKARAAHPQ
jgi:hypothetical protein